MKHIPSPLSSDLVLRRITADSGVEAIYSIASQYGSSPSAVESMGLCLALKMGGRWQPVAENFFIDHVAKIDHLMGDFDSVQLAISPVPQRVTREQNPSTRAAIAHNLGMYIHEASEWGVDPNMARALASQFGSRPVLMDSRPKLVSSSAMEDNSIVGPGSMTYSDWKGKTGPGAKLRSIVSTLKSTPSL